MEKGARGSFIRRREEKGAVEKRWKEGKKSVGRFIVKNSGCPLPKKKGKKG